MTSETLDRLTRRFCAYVDRYRTSGVLHPMHQLKLEHTLRVAADARTIASGLNWSDDEVALAETTGLFHDIARFPQFQQYHSFCDEDTLDHGEAGAHILQTENLLEGLADQSCALVAQAVRHHNKRDLPLGLTAREEKQLRLIRDADRLDIFFVCLDAIRTGEIHHHPEIIMHLDFNGAPTDAVLDQFERGETIDYRQIKSLSDRFVLHLSWIHDLSYGVSKRLIRERKILDQFIAVLPIQSDRLLNCFKKTAEIVAQV